MFFKTFFMHRTSKDATRPLSCNTHPPPSSRSISQCASSPNAPTGTDRARSPGEEASDYEKFLEKTRREEEQREKARQQEIKNAERRRVELSMDPWARRM